MGAVTFSIDPRLIETLKPHLCFDTFVETGTFRGETIETVKHDFKQLYSVELSQHYYDEVKVRFAADSHVNLIQGNAVDALQALIPRLQDTPVLFWLDAHWCVAEKTAGQISQCPLLGELKVIGKLNPQSMVIIDDARLFLATPQAPHEISDWPTFNEVLQALQRLSPTHQLSVVNDCILFFPAELDGVIKQFAHTYGVDWLNIMLRSNKLDESEADRADRLAQIHKLTALLEQSLFNWYGLKLRMKRKLGKLGIL